MDFQTLMSKGGPVMWVLLGYSVIALAIVIERFVYFMRLPRKQRMLEEPTANTGQRMAPEEIIVQAVREAAAGGVRDLVRVASRVGSEQLVKMESGLRTLAWLGNTAPLLGLFGTITGMIKAFMVIEAAGGKVNAQALAGGIWEAMVTTGAGLAVAIPVLFLLHILEGMVDRRARAMQQAASLAIEQFPAGRELSIDKPVHRPDTVSHAI